MLQETEENHQKPTKKYVAVFALLFTLLIGFAAGYLYKSTQTKPPDLSKTLKEKDSEIADLKDQLGYSNNDQGKLIKKVTVDINTDQVPLNSPMFKGKKMDINTYELKGKTLIQKVINVDENSSVIFWDFPNNLSIKYYSDKLAILDTNNHPYMEIRLTDFERNWTQPYVTQAKVKMYYVYTPTVASESGGGYDGDVSLQAYQESFPNYRYAHPAYIEIKVLLNPGLEKSRARLYEIANSLTYTTHVDEAN